MLNIFKNLNIAEKIVVGLAILSLFLPQGGRVIILTMPTIFFLVILILISSMIRRKSDNAIIKSAFYSLEMVNNFLSLLYVYILVATFVEVFYKVELWGGEFKWGYQFLFFPFIAIAICLISAIIGATVGFIIGIFQLNKYDQDEEGKNKKMIDWKILLFLILITTGTVIFRIYIIKGTGGIYPLFNFFISAINWSVIVSFIVLFFVLGASFFKKSNNYSLLTILTLLLIASSVGADFGINYFSTHNSKISNSKVCSDSDGGKNFNSLGKINEDNNYEDRCYDGTKETSDWSIGYTVREFYCGDYGRVAYEDHICAGYCLNGVCVDGEKKEKGLICVDSDKNTDKMCPFLGGKTNQCDIYTVGDVKIYFNDKMIKTLDDYCLDSKTLIEYNCNGYNAYYIDKRNFPCQYGCSDGRCLNGL